MTNVALLRKTIDEAKHTNKTALAAAIGVSMPTFYSRISGRSEFTASEIIALSSALHLNKTMRDKIFLD